MKFKNYLVEMPDVVGSVMEYSPESIQDALKFLYGGKEVTKLEGGNWSIIENEQWYGVAFRDEIRGWAHIIPDGEYMHVKMFYILPEFRGTKTCAVLMQGIKHLFNKPILLKSTDSVSKKAQDLLLDLEQKKILKIKSKLSDGTLRDFQVGDEKDTTIALIMEAAPLTRIATPDTLPGQPDVLIHWTFFDIFPGELDRI